MDGIKFFFYTPRFICCFSRLVICWQYLTNHCSRRSFDDSSCGGTFYKTTRVSVVFSPCSPLPTGRSFDDTGWQAKYSILSPLSGVDLSRCPVVKAGCTLQKGFTVQLKILGTASTSVWGGCFCQVTDKGLLICGGSPNISEMRP